MQEEALWQELSRQLDGLPQPPGPQGMANFRILAAELLRWGKTHNLTGHRTLAGVVQDLFLDALAMAPYVTGNSLLDIGSGAGFPGLPLALALPNLSVTLLEPRAKRVSFQRHAARLMELAPRVTSVNGRAGCAELAGRAFSTVTLRAVGSLGESLHLARPYLAPAGLLLLPRGLADEDAARDLELATTQYQIPGLPTRLLVAAPASRVAII